MFVTSLQLFILMQSRSTPTHSTVPLTPTLLLAILWSKFALFVSTVSAWIPWWSPKYRISATIRNPVPPQFIRSPSVAFPCGPKYSSSSYSSVSTFSISQSLSLLGERYTRYDPLFTSHACHKNQFNSKKKKFRPSRREIFQKTNSRISTPGPTWAARYL